MAAIFKNINGKIWVQPKPGPILLQKRFKIVNGRKTEFAQWVDSPDRVWFAINGINMQMLDALNYGDAFKGDREDDDAESKWVSYSGTVFMLLSSIRRGMQAWLSDKNGNLLSGSNIMSNGDLCLGDGYNPFNQSALDLLLHNDANQDLFWKGTSLEGAWMPGSEATERYFNITTWPTFEQTVMPPPQEITDACKRWWPES